MYFFFSRQSSQKSARMATPAISTIIQNLIGNWHERRPKANYRCLPIFDVLKSRSKQQTMLKIYAIRTISNILNDGVWCMIKYYNMRIISYDQLILFNWLSHDLYNHIHYYCYNYYTILIGISKWLMVHVCVWHMYLAYIILKKQAQTVWIRLCAAIWYPCLFTIHICALSRMMIADGYT